MLNLMCNRVVCKITCTIMHNVKLKYKVMQTWICLCIGISSMLKWVV